MYLYELIRPLSAAEFVFNLNSKYLILTCSLQDHSASGYTDDNFLILSVACYFIFY